MKIINKVKKIVRLLSNSYYLNVLVKHHVAAGIEHNQVFQNYRSNKVVTFVDIGANRGQFALVARYNFPNSKIYSFEPLIVAVEIFRRIFVEDINTKIYDLAIGPEENECIIHVSKADDSSSLLPISTLQTMLYPGTSEKETRTIFQKPLDAILSPIDIKRPALLKIDVQGYEKQVLEGCKSFLPYYSLISMSNVLS